MDLLYITLIWRKMARSGRVYTVIGQGITGRYERVSSYYMKKINLVWDMVSSFRQDLF